MDKEFEIFDTTKHTREWPKTEADLDAVVASFSVPADPISVNLDHKHEGPALGTIASLRREGSRLLAKVSNWSEGLLADIKAKKIFGRSVELYKPGNSHPIYKGQPALAGLAFLGAQRPECKGLAPMDFASDQSQVVSFSEQDDRLTFDFAEALPQEEPAVTITAEQFAEATAKATAAEAAVAERDAKIAALEAEVLKFAEAEKSAKRDARLAELERLGKITPATRNAAVAYFSEDDDATNETRFAEAKDNWPVLVQFGENGGAPAPADNHVDPAIKAEREYFASLNKAAK